ncbi:MAG TPA: PKD domain-containing protein, partial [Methanospirillum sp.]|uniref:PKD domain-containing protein n=1 Tax=Methanospirillum sp. TaxID=45200 RepID=UPI002B750159
IIHKILHSYLLWMVVQMNTYCNRGVLFMIIFVVLISIGGEVTAIHAQFVMKPVQGQVPLTVFFTDTTQGNPIDWRWNFGDGSTGEGKQIMHTYLQPGVYTVSMAVSDESGTDTSTLPDSIRVLTNPFFSPLPTISGMKPSFMADFTVNKRSGTAPVQVQFTDLSVGDPTAWYWDFGDGNSASEQSPIHIYSKPGTYPVSLSISKEGSTSSKEEKNFITIDEGKATASMNTGATGQTREAALSPSVSSTPTPDNVPHTESPSGVHSSMTDISSSHDSLGGEKYSLLNRPLIDFYNQTQALLIESHPGETSDLLTISTNPTSVKAGESFSSTVSGKPGEDVYIWVVIPETVAVLDKPVIPFLVSNQTDIMRDYPSGPYKIGTYVPSGGRDEIDEISLKSLIPADPVYHGTASYGLIRLNQTGKALAMWETTGVIPGKYFIRTESKDSHTNSSSVRSAASSIVVT